MVRLSVSESKHVELTIQKVLVWFGNDNFSTYPYPTHTVVTVLYNLIEFNWILGIGADVDIINSRYQ